MATPKEALELFGRYLEQTYDGAVDALTPEIRDQMEAAIKAAIPIAELHEQAVDLLKETRALTVKLYARWEERRTVLLKKIRNAI